MDELAQAVSCNCHSYCAEEPEGSAATSPGRLAGSCSLARPGYCCSLIPLLSVSSLNPRLSQRENVHVPLIGVWLACAWTGCE